MDKPIKQYMQSLNIDTVNIVRPLVTKVFIALAHKKIPQIKTQTQQTFYANDNYI
jgi:hypothetical protein